MAGTSGIGLVTCSYGEVEVLGCEDLDQQQPREGQRRAHRDPSPARGGQPAVREDQDDRRQRREEQRPQRLAREHRPAPARKRTGVLQHGVLGIRPATPSRATARPLASSSQPIGFPGRRTATLSPTTTEASTTRQNSAFSHHAVPCGPASVLNTVTSTPSATTRAAIPQGQTRDRRTGAMLPPPMPESNVASAEPLSPPAVRTPTAGRRERARVPGPRSATPAPLTRPARKRAATRPHHKCSGPRHALRSRESPWA